MSTPRLAAILLVLSACAPRGAEDGCRWPPADTAGWPVADAGPFVLRTPPGLTEQPVLGTSEYMGLWAGGERALAFHYGAAAADPRGRETGGEEHWRCVTRIGGDSVVVRVGVRTVAARPGLMQRHAVAEAWWPRAGADSARLLVVGWGPEADSARIAREALNAARSVRFRTRWTATDSLRQLHRFCAAVRARASRDPGLAEEWLGRCPAGPGPPADYESVR